MGERSPRRTNNIVLSAEQLDHNASMARGLNKRANNRLRLHHGNIDENQTTNLNSLDYEMRRVKNELKGITNHSGTLAKPGDTLTRKVMPSKANATRRVRKPKRMTSGKLADTEQDSNFSRNTMFDENTTTLSYHTSVSSRRKSLSLPMLPSMTSTSMLSPRSDISQLSSLTPGIQRVNDAEEISLFSTKAPRSKETRRKPQSITRKLSLEANRAVASQTEERRVSVSITDANGETKVRPVSPRESAKEDPSLANINIDAVKDRIQNRLSQPANQDDDDVDPDITPYMHVPPDGLPRTVYLLPPLTDLLNEAKKARYVRRPKKLFQPLDSDDPDRELGIDEIFSKKG